MQPTQYRCGGISSSLLRKLKAVEVPNAWIRSRFESVSIMMKERYAGPNAPVGLDASHALTSLRFFAAFYVLLFHAVPVLLSTTSLPVWFDQLVSFGYVSVSFFFLLSGYILTVAYLGVRPKLRTRQAFYRARFARVYPLFMLTLLFDSPDWFVGHAKEFGGYAAALRPTCAILAAHLLMLQAWIPHLRGIDRPNWSLSVETFFYLIFPFVAPKIWKLRSRSVALLAGAIWISGLMLVFLFAGHISLDALMFMPAFHLGTFMIGIALARWQFLHQVRLEANGTTAYWLLAAALALSLATLVAAPPASRAYLNDGLLAPIFILVVIAVSLNGCGPSTWLGNRYLRLLGDSSYALYLFHFPMLHYFQRLHLARGWLPFAIYVVICLIVSVLSFRYFETPWRMRLAHHAPEPYALRSEPM